MKQKRYFPLDNEQNVLALLQKGYSFIKVGNTLTARPEGLPVPGREDSAAFIEGIPSTAPADDAEHMMLSSFLTGVPAAALHVDASYFN